MASVILDITTMGLDEAIMNVKNAGKIITAATATQMARWYNSNFKRTALEIIETGEGMADNVGRYAIEKQNRYGISHGLGVLTGGLYFAVSTTQPNIKETRGKEVRLYVQFDEPYYIAYVVDGTSRHVGRNFLELAKNKEINNLAKMIGQALDNLDFTLPYPQLIRNVMGPSALPSMQSYG